MLRQILVAGILLTTSACSDPEISCTADIDGNPSLRISVVDSANEPLTDYDLQYFHEGVPKDEFCREFGSNRICSDEPIGIRGEFIVVVTKDGYRTGAATATVDGVCKVVTEDVIVVLQPNE